jgi:hypothetical protein
VPSLVCASAVAVDDDDNDDGDIVKPISQQVGHAQFGDVHNDGADGDNRDERWQRAVALLDCTNGDGGSAPVGVNGAGRGVNGDNINSLSLIAPDVLVVVAEASTVGVRGADSSEQDDRLVEGGVEGWLSLRGVLLLRCASNDAACEVSGKNVLEPTVAVADTPTVTAAR